MLMQIDGTFIFVAISFLIFLFIIRMILFRPILKIMDEREKFYAKNSAMESESKEKSKTLLKERDIALKKVRQEANEIVSSTIEKAKAKSATKLKEARFEANKKVEENKQSLKEASKNVKNEIKGQLTNLVNMVASNVMKENFEADLTDEKINKYLNI